MQKALRDLLRELDAPRTPTLLQRRLGAAYTVCWRVFRVVNAEDAMSGAQDAPSLVSITRLLERARVRGVTAETAEGVRTATEAFHRFIDEHADDRAAFDSMVAGAGPESQAVSVPLHHRRDAYRVESRVWGVQVDLYFSSTLIRRSATDPTKIDVLLLSVMQGFRRLRPDTHVQLLGYHLDPTTHDGRNEAEAFVSRALDVEAARHYGVPVLPEYSTRPLPQMQRIVLPSGWRLHNMCGSSVGLQSKVDVATGQIMRDVPMTVEADGRRYVHMNFLDQKPIGLFVDDLLIDRASFPDVRPDMLVHKYFEQNEQTLASARQTQQFAMEERINPPVRASTAELAEMPRYAEMLEYATGRVGWDLAGFDLYRLRLPFPIIGTSTLMYFADPLQA